MRRTITALVYNRSGVLSMITSVLNRRQVNIESISVGVVDQDNISRMTIVANVESLQEAEQVTKQLNKQIDVIKVSDISEIQAVIAPFRADTVDVAQKMIVVQVVGTHEKINALIEILRPYGIVQMARTGITGLTRG